MQERGIQSPETLDPFMFGKQKDYVQLKSDFILGQNPNQAIKAARTAFLDNEREIKSAAMQARPSLSIYLNKCTVWSSQKHLVLRTETTGATGLDSLEGNRHNSQIPQGREGSLHLPKSVMEWRYGKIWHQLGTLQLGT